MNDLLALAIEAHGGFDRWNSIRTIEADLSVGGALWDMKQLPGIFRDKLVVAETRRQRLSLAPFGEGRLVFTPERVWTEDASGRSLQHRDDGAGAFAGHTQATSWDALHAGYFNSQALWTYLSQPFLYAAPGFTVEEIEPWEEGGEVWRSLRVTFPDTIISHTRTQVTRFGPDGLIRRHDYTVDVLGGARGSNYASEYRNFDGIKVPTRRRVYAHDDAMRKVGEPLLVSIDISQVRFI
ncbi:hypothetical protein D0B54_13200 [Solimonas sp. K1W22B-7]|uniref:hypothetical protein n=1 Tax=Solimonas sp. K1W22B-7 TaxID=2303331 RepID=UPI000E332182|nr:hypothetical protein [Solimonas sp. K1W22B-7]AXQ29588.1 hypothetical protein D0B54_13200 [Solimonas sp. K1W22B-7]